MEIRLTGLRGEKFKGFEAISVDDIGDENLTISGDNGTGKTSLYDLFCWLLTDKDSQGVSDFEIKNTGRDMDSNAADVVAEADFLVDGERLRLKKVLREKWTKRRGALKAEKTGNTTLYYIDGNSVKQKEYKEKVGEFGSEWLIRTLTSPFYFTGLPWAERRKVLMGLVDDVKAEEVAKEASLSRAEELLNGASLEQVRKRIDEELKGVKKEVESLPAIIAELEDGAKGARDAEQVAKELEAWEAEGGGGGEDLQQKLKQALETEDYFRSRAERLRGEEIEALKRERSKLDQEKKDLQGNIDRADSQLKSMKTLASADEATLKSLRTQYKEIVAHLKEFDETICPLCGASVDEGKGKELIKSYNSGKTERLEEINRSGKEVKKHKERAEQEAENFDEMIKNNKARIEEIEAELVSLDKSITETAGKRVEEDDEAEKWGSKAKDIQVQISATPETEDGIKDEVADKIKALKDELVLSRVAEKNRARIEELKKKEKSLARWHEELFADVDVLDSLARKISERIESRINAVFELTRFRLFKTQENGRVVDICEIVDDNGVPFDRGLNRGAQVNMGVDICRTLSRHYGVFLPLWVDNTESVTKLLKHDGQMIGLKVEKDKDLTFEKGV